MKKYIGCCDSEAKKRFDNWLSSQGVEDSKRSVRKRTEGPFSRPEYRNIIDPKVVTFQNTDSG